MLPHTKGALEMKVFIKLAALVLLPSLAVACAEPRGGGAGLYGVQSTLWMPSSIVANGTQILGYAAMLIIALTVVRRHRRDASLFLAASAILHLIAALVPIGIGLYIEGQRQFYDPYKYTYLNELRAAGHIQTAAFYLGPVAMVLLLAGILRASYQSKAAPPP